MNKVEILVTALIFGAVLPILLFLAGWWSSIGLVSDNLIFVIALIGLSLGIIIDILFLKKWLRNVYNTDLKLLIIIYLFYSVCTFGFFMGVPIFNLMIGIAAGVFVGRKSYFKKESINKAKCSIRKACNFTTAVIIIISLASAYFALKDPMDTARNLEGMLNIKSFSITTEMIIGIIIIGGFILALSQYWLTKKAALIAFNHGKQIMPNSN